MRDKRVQLKNGKEQSLLRDSQDQPRYLPTDEVVDVRNGTSCSHQDNRHVQEDEQS